MIVYCTKYPYMKHPLQSWDKPKKKLKKKRFYEFSLREAEKMIPAVSIYQKKVETLKGMQKSNRM